MEERKRQSLFLSENLMRGACAVTMLCGLASIVLMILCRDLTQLSLFEKLVKAGIAAALYWTFARYHWDLMRGLMGGMLFCLMYEESFLVLGTLWAGDQQVFDAYLSMGVQGSLYLALNSMSFLMTIIITLNHFILTYSRSSSLKNAVFGQIAICFKLALCLALLFNNAFLSLPGSQLSETGLGYLGDLSVILLLICIDSQLSDFMAERLELLRAKRQKGGRE